MYLFLLVGPFDYVRANMSLTRTKLSRPRLRERVIVPDGMSTKNARENNASHSDGRACFNKENMISERTSSGNYCESERFI